jgi:hypothetical protein
MIVCLLIPYHVPVVVIICYVPVPSIRDVPSCSEITFLERKQRV